MNSRSLFLFAVLSLVTVWNSSAQSRQGKARHGFLSLTSMTNDAKIYIDNNLTGKTPLPKKIPLIPGKHRLKATRAGYRTEELSFVIRAGKTTELQIDLLPYSGLVKISSNVSGAQIYLNEKKIGHTPLIQNVIVGKHTLKIVHPGYSDFQTTIKVKGGNKHFVEGILLPLDSVSGKTRFELASAKPSSQTVEQANAHSPSLSSPWYTNLHKQWWFWTITGTVVLASIALPLTLSDTKATGISDHQAIWESRLP